MIMYLVFITDDLTIIQTMFNYCLDRKIDAHIKHNENDISFYVYSENSEICASVRYKYLYDIS